MKSYLAVFIGGALGSLCRYAINMSAGSAWFPWPTFIENASGSLLLGLLTGFFSSRAKKPLIQLCLGTGFCGGYTTMSAFSKETALILQSAAPHNGVLYLVASLASGICLAFIGIVLGNRIGGQAGQKKERYTS
ncbi:CrcB family protein [Bacillus sonorensis]|uniref:Fluoride-specific ion channel FluC n=2 Tax=Bacillus sonorensis TaxID=119858 RepID=M5P7G4_9BACI|nr:MULTISPECIES: CrcB family protein [Bacillus]TWK72640.1 putative fluoride ion transporter CrcB [Bacillus paralicheniformis]ASB90307.1 Putative fluoride ion transporter CrcB [Bacillus sonorensis]EME75921.1 membrane protein YhdV [Bacillus sonorensis L12]MCZ0074383.1 CrcB family protein [Bacillus sonorensis]MCZ0093491.1 CrcB family protein [Bacillus sonorensis]